MYQIAICDDDQAAGSQIRDMAKLALREQGIDAAFTVYQSPSKLLADLWNAGCQYDLYLLDILMGDENGVELARTLRSMGSRAKLVFITSSPDFWRDGYKVEASDYLLKPVDPAELSQVLNRLLKGPDTVTFRSVSGSTVLIPVNNICWAEVFDHTVQIHTVTGDYTIPSTLGEVEKYLPGEKFFRCHRSYLVNLDFVDQVERTSLHLTVGARLPISRGNARDIQEAIIRNAEGSILMPHK